MRQSVRRAVATLAVVAGVAMFLLAAGAMTSAALLSTRAASGATCPSPSPSDRNSPLYPQVCGLPAFQALIDQWGVSNFSWGMTSGPTWNVVWLQVMWVTPCNESLSSSPGVPCQHQEYWGANITSGTITGPTVQVYPITACYGCPAVPTQQSGPTLGTWPGWILYVVVSAAGIAALGAFFAWKRRGRPKRLPGHEPEEYPAQD
jgi:hypothetical protein